MVIYRVKGERLHDDMFNFLGSASKSYIKHFHKALHTVCHRSIDPIKYDEQVQGPILCIFHETRNTEPLGYCKFNIKLLDITIIVITYKYMFKKVMAKMYQIKY